MRMSRLALLASLTTAWSAPVLLADVDPHAGMLRFPDVSAEKIVFAYANDLWTVDRDGGLAVPLASPPGSEAFPRFSADGQTIAFMGNYDGGRDLYTIPAGGGEAVRVTHHPAQEILCDWTPEGTLLFYARGIRGNPRAAQLFTVGAEGGLPEMLAVPYGAAASISADGTWLAYTPHTRDQRTWKRYRGGMATDIWLFNLETNESRVVTDWEGTDTLPMWHGQMLYYLSDAGDEHRLNLWSYDPASGRREQITRFVDYDVKWPSIGPGPRGRGEIVFQYGSELYLIDLASRKSNAVPVTIPGDRPTLREQRVDAAQFIQDGGISSTGKRAVAQARGDIWTAPAEHGAPRNLTRTSGVAERSPAWSPDGRWIAYFSDATGEYELYVTQSDGKGETKQLTSGSRTFYRGPVWSPDSKHIAFTDKAAQLYLHTIESGETAVIDKDPWGATPSVSWSHDSRWIAYPRTREGIAVPSIWLYDTTTGERHQVTHGMFGDGAPVFDRKGKFLFFASARDFSNPSYADVDTTFVYDDTQVLVAVPLREDVELPWQPQSDEEEWAEDEEAEEDKAGGDKAGGDEAEAAEVDEAAAAEDDEEAPKSPIHGIWAGKAFGVVALGVPPEMDPLEFTMTIVVREDGSIIASSESMGESNQLNAVTFDETTGAFYAESDSDGMTMILKGTLDGETLSGTWEFPDLGVNGTWEATRTSDEVDEDDVESDEDEAVEVVEIDLEGFEARAFQLPVPSGNFGRLAVNDKNQLIYARRGAGIKLFDLDDDKKEEKTVAAGAMSFDISGDGKKLLVATPDGSFTTRNAAAGGSPKKVGTAGMIAMIDPREEWRQIFHDAWRIQRDFFYVENMHGVDWDAMRDRYAAMLDDCATREDVSYVIRELISELNVGHAYYFGGDGEDEQLVGVGLLGVNFEEADGAYRIAKIIEGGPWDVDARSPLRGKDVKEGDYLLAVNGVPVDASVDPWAAFIGTAGRTITITVSDTPEMTDEAREVVVEPVDSEGGLRYRAWIESNRSYVAERTDGKVGYIYVPDTGVNGQNNLFRQFFGQADKAALIVDERWNGGGQIPTRFIELLNRPVTNYWARRDSKDWAWPPDAHRGPKCMLINGLAGSGGDMFPWLFRQAGLGKLIGTRTWGGLVGLSGNPGLIDGGYTSVPTFGFYEADGTWGVEGHGTDPDLEVLDDPALMVDGGDPQLDAAIALMLEEIERNPYEPAQRPAAPDRSGMGIREEDK